MTDRKFGLDDAYAVQTPEDNRALYRDWAESYETDFTQAHGYVYHEGVVAVFADRAAALDIAPDSPILDVGCGTGIVGVSLRSRGFTTIDGIDISPEMLHQAAAKSTYRTLTEADVTQPLALGDATYAGLLSVGTFTHGHLGPEPIRELTRLGVPGAVFAIGINADHFDELGFGAVFDELNDNGSITNLSFEKIRMYDGTPGDHADDLATVALFERNVSS